jgi:hypothetical protein
MSKIARITVFLLVSLALTAATSVSVRGWLGSTSQPATGVHTVGGLQTDFNHQRSTTAELESQRVQNNYFVPPSGSSHPGGCHSDQQASPQD